MSTLALSIQAANQRTAELEQERAALMARKEHLEAELAKCIGWLGEAEVAASAAKEIAESRLQTIDEMAHRIADLESERDQL